MKTYWHLARARRLPSEYEIASSRLLYYLPDRGFEVPTPAREWYARYQAGSALVCSDWERFADPQETTFARYAARQRDREAFVDGLLAAADTSDHDAALPAAWVAILGRVFAPLRYPCHGLQMLAAYLGSMAPSGRITIAAAFQAADEMRRVHRLAYRLRKLCQKHPDLERDSRATWERDPLWQPLRETVEKLLVTYDWGECFAGLNLVTKPLFDDLFLRHLGRLARRSGDDVLERLFQSLGEDARWHREWSAALARLAVEDTAGNAEVLQGWIARWRPRVLAAVKAFRPVFEALPGDSRKMDFDGILAEIEASHAELLHEAGLAPVAHLAATGTREGAA